MRDGSDGFVIGLLGQGDLNSVRSRKDVTRPSNSTRSSSAAQPVVTYGASVAMKEFLAALLRTDKGLAFSFYSERPLQTTHGTRVSRHHLSELVSGSVPDVMLDITGKLWPPFYARSACGHLFPITITHHTVSYSQLLHSHFLRLIMEPSRPCDAFVGTSRAALKAVRKLVEEVTGALKGSGRFGYRGDYTVIPLGVDTTRFRPRPQRLAREKLRLPRKAFIIMCVGRLSVTDKMDILPLLRVIQRVAVQNAAGEPAILVFVGNGEEPYLQAIHEEAQQLGVSELVHIIVNIGPDEMHWAYPAADVVLFPADNIQETFGLAPVEAMACGVPQIAADWDGYRDTVVHNCTGFLVPTSWIRCDDDLLLWAPFRDRNWHYDHLFLAQSVAVDLDAATAAIAQLMASPDLRQNMSRASRKRAVEEFDWRAVITRYRELWREQARTASKLNQRVATDRCLRPCYFEAFSQYASEILSPETRVSITQSGRRVRLGQLALPPLKYYSDKTIIDPLVVLRLLKILAAQNRPIRMKTVADALVSRVGKSAVYRHLMWLIKYGFSTYRPPAEHERDRSLV